MKKSARIIITAILVFTLSLMVCLSFSACGDDAPDDKKDPPGGGGNVDPTVTALLIDTPPTKTEYYIGETADLTGIVLKIQWSDGVKSRVSASECTVSPTEELTPADTSITITYQNVSATQAITVKNVGVASLSVSFGNTSLKGVVNKPMNFSGIELTATYEDGVSRVVRNFDAKIGTEKVEDLSNVTFDKYGTYSMILEYGGESTSFEIRIVDGFFVEAERLNPPGASDDPIGENESYVNVVNPAGGLTVKRNPGEPASGDAYLGSIFNGGIFNFNVYIEEACYADVILRASSGYMTESVGWSPITMSGMQFNKVFEVSYGVDESSLVPLDISDAVVLEGGHTDDPAGDPLLWVNWMDVDFGVLPLSTGYNIIQFKVISDYVNCLKASCACNVDRLELEYTDQAPAELESIRVSQQPTKVSYAVGETFDASGMEIEASWDDDTTSAVSVSKCNITPSGALTADVTEITVEYRGKTAKQAITVKEAKSLIVKTAPAKITYKSGERFNAEGMEIEAVWGDDSHTNVSLSDCTITPSGVLSVSDTKITVSYAGKTVEQPITVTSGSALKIEAENAYKTAEIPADEKNFVELVSGVAKAGESEHSSHTKGESNCGCTNTSGERLLSDMWNGTVIRYHIFSDTAQKAEIQISVSSYDYGGGGWAPLHTNDVNFKDVFKLKFGASANSLTAVPDVDFVVEGGDNDTANQDLFELWRIVDLGEFDLAAGDNILELTVNNPDMSPGATKGITKMDCLNVLFG